MPASAKSCRAVAWTISPVNLLALNSTRARVTSRVMSSRGERGAVRPAVAAGPARSRIFCDGDGGCDRSAAHGGGLSPSLS